MFESARATQLAAIRSFCTQHPHAVLFDEPAATLMDVFSTKTLPLSVPNLISVEERTNQVTSKPYLLLQYDDGRQIALAEVGIAFAPDMRSTGPLNELPTAVCFRDHATLLDRLKHQLYGHPDQEPTRETVRLLLSCIAILDGARQQGFDVGREEKELESHVLELEKRSTGLPRIP